MTLFDQISKDIVAAMKAKDKVALEALRNIKKVFLEPKPPPGPDGELPDGPPLKILQKLAKQGRDVATLYTSQNRQDLADAELAQVTVIEKYLPQPMSEAEIEAAVRDIIAQTGAQSVKDMGKVMGAANKQMAGKADGKTISEIVRRLLNECHTDGLMPA